MAITLTQATADVRSLLDEPSAQFWQNTELTTWLNQAAADIARRTRTLRTEAQVTVTAGTQNYTAPVDALSLYRVTFVPTGSGQVFEYPLEFMGYNEMDQAWGVYQTFPAAWPQQFTLWGNPPTLTIRLFPVPNQAGVLNVFYYRASVDASAGSDDIDVLQNYEEAVIEYCVYKAKRKDNDPTWQEAKANYEMMVGGMVNETGWFTDQPGQFTTGQPNFPTWAQGGGWD